MWRRATATLIAVLALIAGVAMWREAGPAATPVPQRQPVAGTVPPTRLGMNLGIQRYWSPEWMFNDLVQTGGKLLMRPEAGGFVPLDAAIPRDAGGRPVHVPAGTKLVAILQGGPARPPVGRYRCTVSPGWTMRVVGEAYQKGSGNSFDMTVAEDVPQSVSKGFDGVLLYLEAQRAGVSLTDLACVATDAPPGLFDAKFLADIRPFGVLRFKDPMHIDNAPVRRWAERATPASFSQAEEEGLALEHAVALANALDADPWFSLPMDVDGDYYARFATYVRDHVKPGRTIYVELSNELWNTFFQQGKDAERRGQALYPGVPAQVASDYYYADRTRALMAIWGEVFRGQEKRLVRVIASQAVNPARAERILAHEETWRSVDALATAPYFGDGPVPAPGGNAGRDAIFARAPQMVDAAIGFARAGKAVASRHGLRYLSYEVGSGFDAYNPAGRAEVAALNRDPRMYEMYRLFLRRWQAEVGDLAVFFDSVSGSSFAHKEYTGQPLAEAPKMRALVDFVTTQRGGARPPAPK